MAPPADLEENTSHHVLYLDPGDLKDPGTPRDPSDPRDPWTPGTPGTPWTPWDPRAPGIRCPSGPNGDIHGTPRDRRDPQRSQCILGTPGDPRNPRRPAGGPREPIVDPGDPREHPEASWIDFMIIMFHDFRVKNHDFRNVMKIDIDHQETSGNLLGYL